ncbi:MAG: serine hydrolase [Anaerolineae bacterium]|nr:serine hydrolase [Anaerolineae bacterium]
MTKRLSRRLQIVLFALVLGLLAGCTNINSAETLPTFQPISPSATATPPPQPTATATQKPVPTATTPATPTPYKRPELGYLQAELDRILADFDGVSSYVVIDLTSGQRIERNADVAISGMSLLKIPILIETYAALNRPPDIEQQKLITQTTALSSNFAANLLLRTVISDRDDSFDGAEQVTNAMRELGLFGTFITVPYEQDAREGQLATFLTPANSRSDVTMQPDSFRQTTIGDLSVVLTMLYECAEHGRGKLVEQYGELLTQAECQELLAQLELNDLVLLLEAGLPDDTTFAHKIGYVDETYGDVGIVYSPGGDYVLGLALYTPTWLEWSIASPVFAEVSRLTYRHFNDRDAYSAETLAIPPAITPAATREPSPYPQALVYGTRGVGLTMRETPGGNEVAILPDGAVVGLLADLPVVVNGVSWRRIATAAGQSGWVSADYLITE